LPASVLLSTPMELLLEELVDVVLLSTTAAVIDGLVAGMTLVMSMVDPQTRMSTPPARVMLR
jgi:hypothetical protein